MNTERCDAPLLPAPDVNLEPACAADVTGAFRELSPGRFEARLCLPAGRRSVLRFSRVGWLAALDAVDAQGRLAHVEHCGGFTDWDAPLEGLEGDCRIALTLTPGETLMSPYQKTGLLDRVLLLCLPETYLEALHVRCVGGDRPDAFEVGLRLGPDAPGHCARVVCDLSDSQTAVSQTLDAARTLSVTLRPAAPRRWSCADPFLYTLAVGLLDAEGRPLARYTRQVGLTRARRDGDRLLLNGEPIKLLGLAYREPLPGEGLCPEADLALFREAHVNYLRSLCYPFSEAFLGLCDAAGILVEQGAPVTGLGQTLPARQNAPALRPIFDRMYEELALQGRNHPSVLLWSLGDDCVWGDCFRRGLARLRALDPDRPVSFHLPMTIPQEEWTPDVWSVHYIDWRLPVDVPYDQMVIFHTQGTDDAVGYAMGQADGVHVPVLHDAFAPVPVYDLEDMDRDPGVHEFWGESVKRFVERFRDTEGALGGAVMAAADEDGRFHPALAGYRWGVLDADHRSKPEFFHLKMAYAQPSPRVRLEKGTLWRFSGEEFEALLDPKTGLFTQITSCGRPLIEGGPYLHAGRYPLGPWSLRSLNATPCPEGWRIIAEGTYAQSAAVRFTTLLGENGTLRCDCELLSLERPMPHRVKAGIGLDPGGLTEFGVAWRLSGAVSGIDFARRAQWPDYPEDHIGRPRGRALREHPDDFRAQKFHIDAATVLTGPLDGVSPAGPSLEVLPCGDTCLRLEEVPAPGCLFPANGDGGAALSLKRVGPWTAVRDDAGGIGNTEILAKDKGSALEIAFEGTGLVLRGATDRIRGQCDVGLDGETVARGISQHTPAVYFPSMSRGYEKRFRQTLYAVEGLPFGRHICRIVVRGEHEAASQDDWIGVESVEVLRPDAPRQVMLYVNQAVNYPRLVYGNYMNPPILVGPGDRAECRLRLVPPDPEKRSVAHAES